MIFFLCGKIKNNTPPQTPSFFCHKHARLSKQKKMSVYCQQREIPQLLADVDRVVDPMVRKPFTRREWSYIFYVFASELRQLRREVDFLCVLTHLNRRNGLPTATNDEKKGHLYQRLLATKTAFRAYLGRYYFDLFMRRRDWTDAGLFKHIHVFVALGADTVAHQNRFVVPPLQKYFETRDQVTDSIRKGKYNFHLELAKTDSGWRDRDIHRAIADLPNSPEYVCKVMAKMADFEGTLSFPMHKVWVPFKFPSHRLFVDAYKKLVLMVFESPESSFHNYHYCCRRRPGGDAERARVLPVDVLKLILDEVLRRDETPTSRFA